MVELLLLAASALLVLACGAFVAAEFAFITVDRALVDREASRGSRPAAGVQTALRSLSTQLSGAQVGITITNLGIGFLAEPAIAELLDDPLRAVHLPDAWAEAVALASGLLLATAVTMVFGELVPKNLAIAKPLAIASAAQGFQRLFTSTIRLPIRALNGSANWVVRRLGIEPQEELRSARTARELTSLISRSAEEGTLDRETARLMQRAVTFGERRTAEIMTPRVRMVSVGVDDPVTSVIALANSTGFSRFPAVSGEAHDVVGAVHVKHVVALDRAQRFSARVRDILVDVPFVPESLPLDPLMATLRADGYQLAVVADEYGGTAGVVTLEDVVEEIVGEITDEHDVSSAPIHRRADGSWLLSASLRPDEIRAVTGVPLPELAVYDTVGGLVVYLLGRIPVAGDQVELPLPIELDDTDQPLTGRIAYLTVDRMAHLRIDRLILQVATAETERSLEGDSS